MKPIADSPISSRGSALLAVLVVIFILSVLSASILSYSTTETRLNERNILTLHSRNMAENISLYAAEQLTTKLYRMGSAPVGAFPWSGSSTNVVKMPPNSVLLSDYNTSLSGMEVRCAIQTATPYSLITDPTNPNFGLQVGTATVPIIAKATATHAILGTHTSHVQQDMQLVMTPLFQFGVFYNMDMELFPSQALTLSGPVHTNNSIFAHPDWGATIEILFRDRVSAAEYLIANHAIKAPPRNSSGAIAAATPASGNVTFRNATTGTATSLKNSSNLWRDSRFTTTNYPPTITDINNFSSWATTQYSGNLRVGEKHSVTKLVLPGIGDYRETDNPATTGIDERNNGRQIIESPNHKRYNGTSFAATTDTTTLKQVKISWRAGLYIMVNPDDTQLRSGTLPDGSAVTMLPRTYRAWLNTIVSGTSIVKEVILPGQPSYGSGPGSDGISGTADDIMFKNTLPNQFTNTTSVGVNQVLRMPTDSQPWSDLVTVATAGGAVVDSDQTIITTGYAVTGGSGEVFPANGASATTSYPADAYFFDMRRANNNGALGTAGNSTDFSRSTSNPYTPRPIAKIDFDMGRFKMMVQRVAHGDTTMIGYKLNLPNAAGTGWDNFIYNNAATTTTLGLGVLGATAFDVFPETTTALTKLRRDPFQLYYAPVNLAEKTSAATDPMSFRVSSAELKAAWYDGVAVYIHSIDAEQRSQSTTAGINDRLDSGVRFWNGRGHAPTLTESARTGCTIATNDAIYVIGHFNADGIIDDSASDIGTGSPNYYGGYSGQYPDSASEKLCSLFGDAFTALSQPVYTRIGSAGSYTYAQTGGWCDTYSAFPMEGISDSGWRTAAGGNRDGVSISAGIRPGILPNLSSPGTTGATRTTKLLGGNTEMSTALVTGVVPSNHKPTGLTDRPPNTGANNVNSGGANNYPRLLEYWADSTGLYIRGSMVGLFECRVAMEPFTHGRCHRPPGRYWGLHHNFSQPNHDVPLEPVVLTANRLRFRELTPTQYFTRKTAMEAMPIIP
jgi:hypothetical protein